MNIEERFADLAGEALGLDGPLDLDQSFEELELDSLDVLELVQILEECGVPVDLTKVKDLRTGHDLLFLFIQGDGQLGRTEGRNPT